MSRLFANVKHNAKIDIPGFAPDLTWIEVREELSIGEERKVFAGAIKGQTSLKDGETRTEYDAEKVSFGMVMAYLSDWDAKDEDGKSVDVSDDAIRGLHPDVYHVIEKAVNAHVERVRAKKTKPARKTRDGSTLVSVAG